MGEFVHAAWRGPNVLARNAAARIFAGVAFLFMIVSCIYGPSLGAAPVWDDDLWLAISRNSRQSGVLTLWIDPATPDYFPVSASCWWLMGEVFGAELQIMHASNILLHALSAVVVWRLLGKIGLRGSFIAALLFAVHPLCVESVAWAAEFKNCLSQPLYLTAFVLLVRAQDPGQRRPAILLRWWLATALFVAALLAKPSGIALPVVTLGFILWRRGRLEWIDFRRVVPMLLISLVVGVVAVRFQIDRAIGGDMAAVPPLADRLARTGPATLWYLWNCVWPFERAPLPLALEQAPGLASAIGAWIVLGGALLALARSHRESFRGLAFAGVSFVLLLAPTLSFLPMAQHRIGWVADRFVYLPLVCVVAPIGSMAWRSCHRTAGWKRGALAAAVACSIGLFACVSFLQVRAWSDPAQLWQLALDRNPRAWLAHSRLAVIELERGRSEVAMRHFEGAVALRPDLPETHSNLGTALRALGRSDACVAAYQEAVRRAPESELYRLNLANALGSGGRLAEAESTLRDYLRHRPGSAPCLATLGLTLQAQGRPEAAREAFRKALEADPGLVSARRSMEALGTP